MTNSIKKLDIWHLLGEAISFVFHPIFMPLYTVVLYFYITPRYFLPQNIHSLYSYLAIMSIAIPLLFLLVFRFFKIVKSYKLTTPHERLFFSVIMASVYFTTFYKLMAYHDYLELFPFFFGIFLSLAMFSVFNYQKIKPSIHAMSFSGTLTFLIIWSYYSQVNILIFIASIILLGAIVVAARLYTEAHNTREILIGIITGIAMQIISFYYILEMF